MELSTAGKPAGLQAVKSATEFVHQADAQGFPANVIIVLQTRSHPTTGALYYGQRDNEALFGTLPDILNACLGGHMRYAMEAGGAHAREADGQHEEGWFRAGPSARGGWRGLVLASDGRTVRVPQREDEIVAFVNQYVTAAPLPKTGLTFDQKDGLISRLTSQQMCCRHTTVTTSSPP